MVREGTLLLGGSLFRHCAVLVSVLVFAATDCSGQGYQQNVAMSWNFITASGPLGWAPGGLGNFGVRNGALMFTASAQSYSLHSPAISVPTAPLQLLIIAMSSDTPGPGTVYWAPLPNSYGNFPGVFNFPIIGDGVTHTYYLPMNTSAAPTIYQLGLNVPPGATVAVQSIGLANMIAPLATGLTPNWQFTEDGNTQGWMIYSGVADMSVSGGRLNLHTYSDVTLLAPVAQVSNQLEWFSLLGRVTQTSLLTPWFKFGYLSSANGGTTAEVYIPVLSDSIDHVYNQNVGGSSGWFATVSQLSLTISENTILAISRIAVSASLQGPADIALDACAPATPLVRAGRSFPFSCRVTNHGPQPIHNVSASLALPEDGNITIQSSPPALASVATGFPQTVTWTLIAAQPAVESVSASVTSQDAGNATVVAGVLVNPVVAVQPSPYVPEPAPAYSDYDVGIFYFPGWAINSHWDPIRAFPERQPVLGYYEEGSPQVLDWQIKWAVEHGIKFFAVDWYWGNLPNTPQGEWYNTFLHAYSSAAYRNYAKFCIAYSGQWPTSQPEFLTIVQTWINEYFSQPGYYKVDGRPVVFIRDPGTVDANLGGSSAAALAAARQLAHNAGLPGIYFATTSSNNPPQLAADGYSAVSAGSYAGFVGTYQGILFDVDPDEALIAP